MDVQVIGAELVSPPPAVAQIGAVVAENDIARHHLLDVLEDVIVDRVHAASGDLAQLGIDLVPWPADALAEEAVQRGEIVARMLGPLDPLDEGQVLGIAVAAALARLPVGALQRLGGAPTEARALDDDLVHIGAHDVPPFVTGP